MKTDSDLDSTQRALLASVADRMIDLVLDDPPKKWLKLAVARHADEVAFGPLYEPSRWFAGDGGALTDADLVRLRRAIARLESRGLVEVTDFGRRSRHLRLTPAAVPVVVAAMDLDADDRAALAAFIGETVPTADAGPLRD